MGEALELSIGMDLWIGTDFTPNFRKVCSHASSETQGQLAGVGKSLNGREINSGEEKSRTTFLTFLRPNFFLARLDFFPPPLTAPGSPRMAHMQMINTFGKFLLDLNSQLQILRSSQ